MPWPLSHRWIKCVIHRLEEDAYSRRFNSSLVIEEFFHNAIISQLRKFLETHFLHIAKKHKTIFFLKRASHPCTYMLEFDLVPIPTHIMCKSSNLSHRPYIASKDDIVVYLFLFFICKSILYIPRQCDNTNNLVGPMVR